MVGAASRGGTPPAAYLLVRALPAPRPWSASHTPCTSDRDANMVSCLVGAEAWALRCIRDLLIVLRLTALAWVLLRPLPRKRPCRRVGRACRFVLCARADGALRSAGISLYLT